jgi:hypothetical protein
MYSVDGMAQPKPPTPSKPEAKVPTEPGFEKRLGDMYKKVLHPPPKHVTAKGKKAATQKKRSLLGL